MSRYMVGVPRWCSSSKVRLAFFERFTTATVAQFGFNVQCERGKVYSTNCNSYPCFLTKWPDSIHRLWYSGVQIPRQGSSSQNPVLYDFVDNLTSLDGVALKDKRSRLSSDFSKYIRRPSRDGSHARIGLL